MPKINARYLVFQWGKKATLDIFKKKRAVCYNTITTQGLSLFDKRLLIFLCFLLNSGCFLFGPTYKKPILNIPTKWPNQRAISLNDEVNLPALRWWKQYNSPELDALITSAIKNNAEPNIAIANIEYAHSQLQEIKLEWLPTMTMLAGYSQFPIYGNPGASVIAFPMYAVNLIQLYKQQKGARARYEASFYARDSIKLALIAQVSATFFTLLAQIEALELNNALLKDYRTYLKLAQNQFQSGLIPQDTIDMLTSQISETESQIELNKHNIVVSKNALHYLVNENPGDLSVKKRFESINTDGIIPGDIPVRVLQNRPDVKQAEALLRAANADIGASIAALLPTLTIGAFLGTGSRVGSIKLAEAGIITPVVDLPLLPQIKASKATYKIQYAKYIAAVRGALRDVANDLSAYLTYSNQLKNTLSALHSVNQHCYLVGRRYHYGISDNIEFTQCKIRIHQLKLLANKNKLEKMNVIITLYQDLAGGYNGA